jgi:hypothetical protein
LLVLVSQVVFAYTVVMKALIVQVLPVLPQQEASVCTTLVVVPAVYVNSVVVQAA